MVNQPLDVLPGWAVYPLAVIVLLAALAGGYYYAKGRGAKAPAKSDRGVGAISGATLGLLAFLLAFVVGFGVNVWQERRVLVVSEANAISTTYLRAGYLAEPYRSESRKLLIEYADQRVAAYEPGRLAAAIARSEEIQRELWTLAEELVKGGDTAAVFGLYVSSLNEVIDLHTERVNVGLYVRVPPLILSGDVRHRHTRALPGRDADGLHGEPKPRRSDCAGAGARGRSLPRRRPRSLPGRSPAGPTTGSYRPAESASHSAVGVLRLFRHRLHAVGYPLVGVSLGDPVLCGTVGFEEGLAHPLFGREDVIA